MSTVFVVVAARATRDDAPVVRRADDADDVVATRAAVVVAARDTDTRDAAPADCVIAAVVCGAPIVPRTIAARDGAEMTLVPAVPRVLVPDVVRVDTVLRVVAVRPVSVTTFVPRVVAVVVVPRPRTVWAALVVVDLLVVFVMRDVPVIDCGAAAVEFPRAAATTDDAPRRVAARAVSSESAARAG